VANWPSVGKAVKILEEELSGVVQRLPKSRRKIPQVIVYSGWQRAREPYYSRPIIGHIKHNGFGTVTASKSPRYWNVPSRRGGFPWCLSAEPDGYLSSTELGTLQKSLQHSDPDGIEATLVTTIRGVARTQSTVGQSCMSIVIPRLADTPLRVRYLPASSENVQLVGGAGSVNLGAVFTPWIVSPALTQPPQVIAGSVRPGPISLGNRVLTFDLPVPSAPITNVIGYVGTQSRRRPR
jgi:hypothetical protein